MKPSENSEGAVVFQNVSQDGGDSWKLATAHSIRRILSNVPLSLSLWGNFSKCPAAAHPGPAHPQSFGVEYSTKGGRNFTRNETVTLLPPSPPVFLSASIRVPFVVMWSSVRCGN